MVTNKNDFGWSISGEGLDLPNWPKAYITPLKPEVSLSDRLIQQFKKAAGVLLIIGGVMYGGSLVIADKSDHIDHIRAGSLHTATRALPLFAAGLGFFWWVHGSKDENL
ncbi:MAG: hypothetical protein F6K05_32575 [Okeania sp. SIO1H2]|nr:hypothetical protein [Okeania sp. SIO1H2]